MKYFKPIPNTPEATFARLRDSHVYEFTTTVEDIYALEKDTTKEEIVDTVLRSKITDRLTQLKFKLQPGEADQYEIYAELVGPAVPKPATDRLLRVIPDKVMYEQSYRIILLPIAA